MSSVAEAAGERRSAVRPKLRLVWILALGFILGLSSWFPARRFVKATEMLIDLAGPAQKGRGEPVSVVGLTVEHPGGAARAYLYLPRVTPHRCLVIGHGVHYKSIDEPRLVRFASELSKAGAVVLTPELAELADYRVTASGAEVLGESVRALSARCPAGSRVGLLGFSFAGGLSLVAALDRSVSDRLAYVASVGGYHDLRRVLSFLLSDRVETPTGPVARKAHEYGFVVLLYEYLDSFVDEEDRPAMREAILAWLHENRPLAWTFASGVTTARSEETFVALASGKTGAMKMALAAALAGKAEVLGSLSPVGRLGEIPVPVYLLHGTGDSVIPPEETVWAEQELRDQPHRALVTPLIEHVELDKSFHIGDAFDLVAFMAGLI